MFSISKEIWPVRRGSVRADTKAAPKFVPIDRNQAWRIFRVAESMELRSRLPGKQDGDLGRNGVRVLFILLFNFLNHKHGRLDPSHEAISKAAGISLRSVAKGLQALRRMKVLDWLNRCIGRDTPEGWRLEQITNAYTICLRIVPNGPPLPDNWGAPTKVDPELEDTYLRLRAELEAMPGDRLKLLKLLAVENLILRAIDRFSEGKIPGEA